MKDDFRSDPDELFLKSAEENAAKKGRLKIFFGYAAGVGKTYSMLEAAHKAIEDGADLIVGYIEPHTRPETMALLEGLEIMPPLSLSYRGILLREFDLDAVLLRNPAIVLVDELAHTNAEGCRHRKRYMDVQELLRNGVDVWTTVNVQHIESLNDLVSSITGVAVNERVPDVIFDSAAQVEVIDLEPEDLLTRLRQGKIYREKQAQKALSGFFSPHNLAALREISLRRTADRLNLSAVKEGECAAVGAGELILTCLSPSPSNAKVIRNAARMSAAFKRGLIALYVEKSDIKKMDEKSRGKLAQNIKLAKDLGARVVTVYGDDVAAQIAEYAKIGGISKIVLGRTNHKTWFFSKNLIEKLSEMVPNLDIYIIPDNLPPYRARIKFNRGENVLALSEAVKSVAALVLSTLVGLAFDYAGFAEANIMMVYILGVLFTSLWTNGWIYGASVSLASVFAFNFFFTDPRMTFMVYDSSYPVTFIIMVMVSVITGTLTMRIKRQAAQSAEKAYRTEVLLETINKTHNAVDADEIIDATASQIVKLLERSVLFYLPDEEGIPQKPLVFTAEGQEADISLFDESERAVAVWVLRNNKYAGAGTDTLPSAKCTYYAVRGHDKPLAVAGIAAKQATEPDAFQKNLLLAILTECGVALEKVTLAEAKREVEIKAQRESLRANLLRAVSHDLRTPLTCITGNAAIILDRGSELEEEKKIELCRGIYDDSLWLAGLVENLLSVTRIENGTMNIKMEPELVEDVFAEAVKRMSRCKSHKITVLPSDEIIMAEMDARLIVQVVINLIDNAVKYTTEGTEIIISAAAETEFVTIKVADTGEGISAEARSKIFDMFYTAGGRADGRRGLGLGLALCKSIINAHGGAIYMEDNVPHGSVFCFTLKRAEVAKYE